MSQEGWMWQGRQEHGWFGHGTKPQNGPAGGGGRGGTYGSAPASLDERIRALGHAAVAGLPASKRYHPAASFDGPALDRLVGAMRAWVGGLGWDHATFAVRFFDRHPSSPVVGHLRRAAEIVAGATTSAEVRAATDALAAGMLDVGLDGWPRFLKDAHERAQVLATSAARLFPGRSKPGTAPVVKVADRDKHDPDSEEFRKNLRLVPSPTKRAGGWKSRPYPTSAGLLRPPHPPLQERQGVEAARRRPQRGKAGQVRAVSRCLRRIARLRRRHGPASWVVYRPVTRKLTRAPVVGRSVV